MKNLIPALSAAAILFISFTGCSGPEIARPNIVLIMADDLGFECIQANGGSSYMTPFLNEMASEGIRFENCHSQPLCTPSRVQIMTGKYNVRNYTRFGELDRNEVTFGNLLEDAGYRTAIAGKWQLGKENDSPQHFGFEQSCLWQQSLPRTDKKGYDTRFSNPVLEINGTVKRYTNGEFGPDIVSDFICDFMEEHREKPFFAYYPMILTHCPFVPTPGSEQYDPEDPGSLSYKGEPGYFPDMVTYMDKIVGKILSKIEELGLSENTIIIFTGDNGTDQPIVSHFRGMDYPGGKGRTGDNGTHVPLIAQWKNSIDAGMVCNDLVDFSDILPTICDIANLDLHDSMVLDGRSFGPQLFGKQGTPREWIYCWYSRSGNDDKLKELARDEKYKLYTTGEFYNVKEDFFEKEPIPPEEMTTVELDSYTKLKDVLKKYSSIR